VLAQVLVVHLATATFATPSAYSAFLVLPDVQRAIEMERLEMAYNAGRRQVVERDTAYPAVPCTASMRYASVCMLSVVREHRQDETGRR